jgi:hypothetical protein
MLSWDIGTQRHPSWRAIFFLAICVIRSYMCYASVSESFEGFLQSPLILQSRLFMMLALTLDQDHMDLHLHSNSI